MHLREELFVCALDTLAGQRQNQARALTEWQRREDYSREVDIAFLAIRRNVSSGFSTRIKQVGQDVDGESPQRRSQQQVRKMRGGQDGRIVSTPKTSTAATSTFHLCCVVSPPPGSVTVHLLTLTPAAWPEFALPSQSPRVHERQCYPRRWGRRRGID